MKSYNNRIQGMQKAAPLMRGVRKEKGEKKCLIL